MFVPDKTKVENRLAFLQDEGSRRNSVFFSCTSFLPT